MKNVIVAYLKALFLFAVSPLIAVAAGVIVLLATWKAVLTGLAGVGRD